MRVAFYNMGPVGEKVTNARARVEVPAILNTLPKVGGAGFVETVGRIMPDVPGQHKIHNTSRPSRANLTLYVRDDHFLGRRRWHDFKETWPRVEHDGIHPPRSALIQNVDDDKTLILSHAPQGIEPGMPRATQDALIEARHEWLMGMTDEIN